MHVIGYGMGLDANVVKSYLEETMKDGNFEVITDPAGGFDVQKSVGYMRLLMIIMEGKTGKIMLKNRDSLPKGEEQRQNIEDMCKHHNIILAYVDEEKKQAEENQPLSSDKLEVMSFAI